MGWWFSECGVGFGFFDGQGEGMAELWILWGDGSEEEDSLDDGASGFEGDGFWWWLCQGDLC